MYLYPVVDGLGWVGLSWCLAWKEEGKEKEKKVR